MAYRNIEDARARQKAWREANADALRMKKAAYYKANREAISDRNRAYYEANRLSIRERVKDYQRDKRGEKRIYDATYYRIKARRHGLTLTERRALLELQSGLCACCKRPIPPEPRAYHTHHDHATGMVLDILCPQCNVGLGQFEDNITRLRMAVRYLESVAERQALLNTLPLPLEAAG